MIHNMARPGFCIILLVLTLLAVEKIVKNVDVVMDRISESPKPDFRVLEVPWKNGFKAS